MKSKHKSSEEGAIYSQSFLTGEKTRDIQYSHEITLAIHEVSWSQN